MMMERNTYTANQYRIASITYMTFVCLIGICLITIEPFKACTKCENRLKLIIESFFIFLYLTSIIWILVLYILIVVAKKRQKIGIKIRQGFDRRLSLPIPPIKNKNRMEKSATVNSSNPETGSSSGGQQIKISIVDKSRKLAESSSSLSTLTGSTINVNKLCETDTESKFYFTYDYENGTGELYMRVGTAIFAMCSMIDRCLSLIQMIETYFNNYDAIVECRITYIVSIAAKILSILFIFTQSFFIFKYANIVINYGKNSAVLGLMHIVCTNFCVFFRTVVYETVTEIRHHQAKIDHRTQLITDSGLNSTRSNMVILKHRFLGNCLSINTLPLTTGISLGVQEAQDKVAPYLYSCIIEYSLMCMSVFCILWSSIRQGFHSKRPSNSSASKDVQEMSYSQNRASFDYQKRRVNLFVIDCAKSTTGLFFGIFVLLMTLIALITYFIYKTDYPEIAVQISEISELILITCSLIIALLIFCKLHSNSFVHKSSIKMSHNETLCVAGLAGIYLFGFYSLIAITSRGFRSRVEVLSFSIQVMSIIESSVQSFLIINSLRTNARNRLVKNIKPARSLITLLILINVSLWLSETFSVKKYEMDKIQLDFYDINFWSIVSSVATPLAIFFRFHASVCLSDVWKTLYEYNV